MGDRGATVPYVQKTFDLPRQFFCRTVWSTILQMLHGSSESEIRDLSISNTINQTKKKYKHPSWAWKSQNRTCDLLNFIAILGVLAIQSPGLIKTYITSSQVSYNLVKVK